VHATPEKMAFVIRHTCGIVCAPLTGEIARRLHLAPMVADADAIHGTAFTVSVDYRHGTTTGISAEDRTATIRALANGNAGRADFVRPGHIFPLIAKEGGVLMRSGHTEAAIDLCRLAGLEPVAAICELVNDDGTVMRGPQVAAFAEAHRLERISVADLIAYRQAREKLVTRVVEFKVASEIGELTGYAYVTPFDKVHHYAFVYGTIGDGAGVPTRLHRATVIGDLFGGAKPIHEALAHFRSAGDDARGDQFGTRTQRTVARGRARRADPARSADLVDPAVGDAFAHLCRPRRLRHRDRRDRAGRERLGQAPVHRDCFVAEFILGPREARTRGLLAMTSLFSCRCDPLA
jgi:3,4-dihydroxy-2-butanone 4-phosphate synthase